MNQKKKNKSKPKSYLLLWQSPNSVNKITIKNKQFFILWLWAGGDRQKPAKSRSCHTALTLSELVWLCPYVTKPPVYSVPNTVRPVVR